MFYYEVLQFYYNETLDDYEPDPLWDDMIPSIEHWTIYDNANGNLDSCYRAPYAYQGKYWISYDDEFSVNIKARFANHYGLKGAFIWEVDTDNFKGLFGKERYTLLAEISRTIASGEGLAEDEILGPGNENMGKCEPAFPMCDAPWPTPAPPTVPTVTAGSTTAVHECHEDEDCNDDINVICLPDYSNCFYCDGHQCRPGCANTVNCGGEPAICTGAHRCATNGDPVVVGITVKTAHCQGCDFGEVEQGLQLRLTGLLDLAECTTDNLDNPEKPDYVPHNAAVFNSRQGIGGCGIDLYQSVDAASARWTGAGTWTPDSADTVCVDFFGETNTDCCCSLATAISAADGWTELTDCHC